MDEVALDDRCPLRERKVKEENGDVTEREDELPWCVLCNDDATIRCLDCGGDLYCTRCNKEAHRSWGDDDHRCVEYKKK